MSDRDRFIEAREKGYAWMLVCRDMYDAFDADSGVYFSTVKTKAEVDGIVRKSGGDQKIMGIYDLSRSFDEQFPGTPVENWENDLERA